MAGESSHGVSRVVHHKDYYLRGGDMTVLVENHLYRIHSYFFDRESLFFRQKFSASDSGAEEERGSTDNNAYTLEDVKSDDFARLLWVFYNPKYSVYEAPLETWLSILKLANRWSFDNVKELSVRELEKIEIESVEKISIYHDNNISRFYLIPSYIDVCKRDRPLSFTEGMKLGMETVLRVAEARERLRQQTAESCMRTPTFEDFEDAQVEVLIREIFQLGSRPTSPSPATAHPNGINGSTNGTTIKLSPAPPGNSAKPNGTTASRANGGSATDPKNSSLDTMRSIDSVLSSQASSTVTPALATPAPATATTQATAPQKPQSQAPQAPLAPTPTGPTPSASPVQPPLVPDKADNSQGNSLSSFMSTVGAGELSSSADLKQGAGSDDVSITIVPPPSTENSNNVTDPNENLNDTEKDELGKDNDTASVISDVEAGKGRQGANTNKNRRRNNKKGN